MPKVIDDLKLKFQALPPGQRRNIVVGGALVGLLALTYMAVNTFSEPPKERKAPPRKVQYDVLTGKESRSLGVDQVVASINTINKRLAGLDEGAKGARGGASALQKAAAADPADKGEKEDSAAALARLMDDPKTTDEDRELLKEIQARRKGGGDDGDGPRPKLSSKRIHATEPRPVQAAPLPPPVPVADPAPPAPKPSLQSNRIKTFTQKKTDGAKKPEDAAGGDGPAEEKSPNIGVKGGKKKNVADGDAIVLPAGSIISGTLITGMDASSSSAAKREPFPALLRIKAEAVLPNRFRMDITDCFIVSSGYADLASERAYLRAEAISCVKDDGSVLESNINAFAVGEDGKTGIRGRLVSKEGQLIAKSLMAGFLSGISNAMKPAKIPTLSLNPTSHYQVERPDLAILGQESALGGISSATSEIAKYYLDMARNMFPIVEIDAGRKIDFIVQSGARLRNNNQMMGGARGINQMGGAGGALSSGFNSLQQGLNGLGAAGALR